jgi:hypothetical protein
MRRPIHPHKLRQQIPRRPTPKHQHATPDLHPHPLNPMRRTRRRLDQYGLEIGHVVTDGVHQVRGIPAVLSKAAGHVATEGGDG